MGSIKHLGNYESIQKGIDAIVDAGGSPQEIRMHPAKLNEILDDMIFFNGHLQPKPRKVELYGLPVIADPMCPPEGIYIL